MIKTNKVSNLHRLNSKNIFAVFLYLLKSTLKLKVSPKELSVYSFYNVLIHADAVLVKELYDFYIIKIKNDANDLIKIRKQPSSDIYVLDQIFGIKEYHDVVKTYKQNFKGSNTNLNIIDAGSNIGLTSIYFSHNFKINTLICIEPETNNFDILSYNLENKKIDKLVKINGAIWNINSNLKVVRDFRDQSDWAFRVVATQDDDGIQAFTINQIILDNHLQHIDILKIDIEGSEKQVFTDINTNNLDFLLITKIIAIEIHNEFNCRDDIYKVLKNYNFDFFESGQTTIGVNKTLLI